MRQPWEGRKTLAPWHSFHDRAFTLGTAPAAQVEPGAVIAAGAYVEEGITVPSGEVWAGNPAKKLRDVKPGEAEYLKTLPGRYVELSGEHKTVMKALALKQKEYFA
jgi:hypothetical protein